MNSVPNKAQSCILGNIIFHIAMVYGLTKEKRKNVISKIQLGIIDKFIHSAPIFYIYNTLYSSYSNYTTMYEA